MYLLAHKNNKTKSILGIITIFSLLIGEVWFFGIFMSVNPNSVPILDMSKQQNIVPVKDATYQVNIVNNVIILHEAKEKNSPVLDVTGPFIPMIIALSTFLLLIREKYVNHKKSKTQAHDEKTSLKENETPLDLLKMRYAKGEITKEEFDRILKDLE